MSVGPPHTPEAEKSVLAQMMNGGSRVAGQVIGTLLEAGDFFSAPNRALYETIYEHYYKEIPIDPITVAEGAMDRLKHLYGTEDTSEIVTRVANLAKSAPPGDVVDHAKIIKAKSDLRKLQQVSADTMRMIEEGKLSPQEIGAEASHQAMQIATSTLLTTDILSFADLGRRYVKVAEEEMAARAAGKELGAHFGLKFIDNWTRGVRPTELWFVGGEPGAGKALDLDTPLPTPTGWTTMGEVRVGDELLDEKGRPTRVTAATDVQMDRPCYRLWFSDGSSIVADEEHEWMTGHRKDYMLAWRRGKGRRDHIRTTGEIASGVTNAEGRSMHSVLVAEALDLPHVNLLIDPYVLGVWLGDGTSEKGEITTVDEQVVEEIVAAGFRVSPVGKMQWKVHGLYHQLVALGLKGEKHIPLAYLRASYGQRLALLQGVVDSDGHVDKKGRVEVALTNEALAHDVRELALTMGLKATWSEDVARYEGRVIGPRYRIRFAGVLPVARLQRKADRLKRDGERRGLHLRRWIVKVEAVKSRPVRCVEVSGDSHLYLAGDTMIPTHNSAVCWNAGLRFAERQALNPKGERVGCFVLSLEMGETDSEVRIAQGLTKIDGAKLREARQTREDLQKIVNAWGRRKDIPLFFNFASTLRASQLRALCVEAIRRHNCGLIIIDHFRYFDLDHRLHGNVIQEDEEKARFLKEDIAKDLNVAVVCLAHTTKSIENQNDRRPTLSNLRGSGLVAAHADFVSFVYRPFMYASEQAKNTGEVFDNDAEMIFRKNRHGVDGISPFYFDPFTMTVEDPK